MSNIKDLNENCDNVKLSKNIISKAKIEKAKVSSIK